MTFFWQGIRADKIVDISPTEGVKRSVEITTADGCKQIVDNISFNIAVKQINAILIDQYKTFRLID